MQRLALVSLILFIAVAGPPRPSAAQSSMDVVPPLHWSYGALNLLAKIGELEGYPPGFFDPDSEYRAEHGVALRRYELEQAVARARVSTWNRLNWQQNYVVYLVSDLCHEYSAPPDHDPDPARDNCQCMAVIEHGLIVPRDYWTYGAVRELIDAGLVAELPDAPVRFPLGQQDFIRYTRLAREALDGRAAAGDDTGELELTVVLLENEYFDPFAAFRTGYQTITDWVCPALEYLADTGYVEGWPNDYFNTSAPHFAKAETMPTMQDCYEATLAFQSRLGELQAAGEDYPVHLEYLAEDLAAICKPPPPPQEAEPEEQVVPERPQQRPPPPEDDEFAPW